MSELRPLRILIVEDEALIAMDLEATIQDEGHVSVGWARSAAEAIKLYQATNPDIAFLDVQLVDGSSGIDVAADLKKRIGARYVFLTANASIVEGDLHGGIGVIQKPVSLDQLKQILKYLQHGLMNPPPAVLKPDGLLLAKDFRGFD